MGILKSFLWALFWVLVAVVAAAVVVVLFAMAVVAAAVWYVFVPFYFLYVFYKTYRAVCRWQWYGFLNR